MAYATRDDVFNLGLSAVAFVSRPRAISLPDAVDLTTGRIRLRGHGFSSQDLIMLEQVATGSMPIDYYGASLSSFIYYTPTVLGNDIFQLLDPATGIPFLFTGAGTGWAISVDPMRRLDMHLEDTAGQIDECLTAECPPIKVDPVTGLHPWQLRGMNARMAALACATTLQFDNAEARVAIDRIEAQRDADKATRDDWKAGKPLNPRPVDQDTVPNNGTRASAGRLASGWGTGTIG